MRVTGEYQDGTKRQAAWGVETSGTSPIMALELETDDVPEAIRIRFMTFADGVTEVLKSLADAHALGYERLVGGFELRDHGCLPSTSAPSSSTAGT
jgi:hypothetical protein